MEPDQTAPREKIVVADVPSPLQYLHYRTPGRLHDDFQALDVVAYLLGGGRSSFLYRELIRNHEWFAEVSAGMLDTYDHAGLLIEARPAEDVDTREAYATLQTAIERFVREGVTQEQLDKTINRLEHVNHFKTLSVAGRANELAFYASFDRLDLVNTETERYLALTVEQVNAVIHTYLRPALLSVVEYRVQTD